MNAIPQRKSTAHGSLRDGGFRGGIMATLMSTLAQTFEGMRSVLPLTLWLLQWPKTTVWLYDRNRTPKLLSVRQVMQRFEDPLVRLECLGSRYAMSKLKRGSCVRPDRCGVSLLII